VFSNKKNIKKKNLVKILKNELHVVFGASGNSGSAIIRELVRKKFNVRGINRSGKANVPEIVEVIKADIFNEEASKLAIDGATVIYNCINIPYSKWVDDYISLTKKFIKLVSNSKAKIIIIDNLYMYGSNYVEPLREDMESLAQTKKGKVRAEIADLYLQAHKEGRINVAICRASDFYGPGVLNSQMGERVMPNVLQGKKVSMLFNLDAPHTFSFIDDYAKAVVSLTEHDEAFGQVWHIPAAEPITQREFLKIAYEEANKSPKISSLSGKMFDIMTLFIPILKEIKELSYQFEKPFIMEHSKYENKFGLNVTPHREAIRSTLDWYSNNYSN